MNNSEEPSSGLVVGPAGEVTIGGDAVGRDKITNNNYNLSEILPRYNLPSRDFLTGRENELRKIGEILHPDAFGWGIVISGPPGIGKTTLAIEAGHRVSSDDFPAKLFLSAKKTKLTSVGEKQVNDSRVSDYENLLREIGRALGDDNIYTVSSVELTFHVLKLLNKIRALLVLDNIEIFNDVDVDRLSEFLSKTPRTSKVVVTSRLLDKWLEAKVLVLNKLGLEAGIELTNHLIENRQYKIVLGENEKREIYKFALGNPLLITWIVGLIGNPKSRFKTISDTIEYMKRPTKNNDPLQFVFGDLLSTLSKTQIRALSALHLYAFPARLGFIADLINDKQSLVKNSLDELVGLSIVEYQERQALYSLPEIVYDYLQYKTDGIFYSFEIMILTWVYISKKGSNRTSGTQSRETIGKKLRPSFGDTLKLLSLVSRDNKLFLRAFLIYYSSLYYKDPQEMIDVNPKAVEQMARDFLEMLKAIEWKEYVALFSSFLAVILCYQKRWSDGLPYASYAVEVFSETNSHYLREARIVLAECEKNLAQTT